MSDVLWLPASSPLFFYAPSPAYFITSSATSPWLGGLDQSLSPPKNTRKSTTGSSSLILPSIYAVSFTPIWDQSSSFQAGLAVDSSQPTQWQSGQNSTPQGGFAQHTFQLEVQCEATDCSSSPFKFHGAWVETEFAPPGTRVQNVTLDDASPLVTYSGFTTVSPPSSYRSDSSIPLDPSVDSNGSLSSTSTPGASASVSFLGTSILVYGLTDPSLGSFVATLDGSAIATLNASNDVTTHSTILFFATDLAANQTHNLNLTCQDGGLVLDDWVAHGPAGSVGFVGSSGGLSTTIGPTTGPSGTIPLGAPTSSSSGVVNAPPSGSPNAGAIIGGILGALLGLGLLIFLLRKALPLMKKNDKTFNAWDAANNLQVMKNEKVHVTTTVNQRYVYPGLG